MMNQPRQTSGLDEFSRRYLYLLAGVVAIGLLWWLFTLDYRVAELNDLLEADEQLAAYPYQFRVLSLDNGSARMSSPRSAQMSAIQGLRILFPQLTTASADSAEMLAAQVKLARTQSRAAALVSAEADVNRVIWVLDERWLGSHGVYVQ
ncbi:hypothetical protein [Seongchinamella sediminis]|uniref:hypothetical protein n=1 Tax=Seongchinamella sediminis TaxID=2283635 RepID=UPI001966CFAA|nr:hypothetical protein [Seongchinamella sediminis]